MRIVFLIVIISIFLSGCTRTTHSGAATHSDAAIHKQPDPIVAQPLNNIVTRGKIRCSIFKPAAIKSIVRSKDGIFESGHMEIVKILVKRRCYPVIADQLDNPPIGGPGRISINVKYDIESSGLVTNVVILDDVPDALRERVRKAAQESLFDPIPVDGIKPNIINAVVKYTLIYPF